MAENGNTHSNNADKQSMVRLDIYIKRHPSLSSADFHKRWSQVHGTLLKGWLAEKGIVRYTQYHTPPEMCAQAVGIHDDAKTVEFDGHAEIVVPNIDVLKKLVEDSFFSEFAAPDEEALVDMNTVMRSIGYEEILVENGKVI